MVLTSIGAVTSNTVTRSISSTMSTWFLAISSKEIITAFWSGWYIFTICNLFKHDINYKRGKRAIFSKNFFLSTSFKRAKLNYTYPQLTDTFTLLSTILALMFLCGIVKRFLPIYFFLIPFYFLYPRMLFTQTCFLKRRYNKMPKSFQYSK